jgi:CubicO group peptidase (beta-lactamase class C family)
MTRALLALLLILGHLPVAAAPRSRAVRYPSAPEAPAAIVTAARQAAQAAMAIGVPAVQIAVSHRGDVIYSEAFGMSDRETPTAATPRSVMQIGSITKQFTAAAILRLAERGALSVDDRIEKFVPEFDPRGRTVTLRHLMQHRSGLPRDWYKFGDPFPFDRYFSVIPRQHIIAGLNAQPFDFAPGTTFSYSNAGYMLLGYAIESITGTEYAEFFHSEFALPLGLIDTGVCGMFNVPRPDGYGLFGGKPVRLPAVHPSGLISSGSLCSTASDLTRWAHLLATGSVMLPASYARMTTPGSPFVRYGFGLGLDNILGQPAASHNGGIDGYLSYLFYFPQRDIAVAVITNAWPVPADHALVITEAVAKAALGAL